VSLEAPQERLIWLWLIALAANRLGTEGAVISGGTGVVAKTRKGKMPVARADIKSA